MFEDQMFMSLASPSSDRSEEKNITVVEDLWSKSDGNPLNLKFLNPICKIFSSQNQILL